MGLQQFAHDREILVFAENAETCVEEDRQRTVIVIGRELAVAGLERKAVDELEASRGEGFECSAQQRARCRAGAAWAR